MSSLILYFSGTGNTEYIARMLKNKLTNCDAYSIETKKTINFNQYDELIIGFPIYACSVPSIMKDYLKKLPVSSGQKLYLFCTRGFFTGNALKEAYHVLKKKGYLLYGKLEVTMPGSDGLAFLSKESKYAQKMFSRDYQSINEVDDFIRDFKNDKPIKLVNNALTSFGSTLMRILYPLVANGLKKKYHTDQNCRLCQRCIHICPKENIALKDGSIQFNDQCILCMRCIHQCPSEAIQISKKTVGKIRYNGPSHDFNKTL